MNEKTNRFLPNLDSGQVALPGGMPKKKINSSSAFRYLFLRVVVCSEKKKKYHNGSPPVTIELYIGKADDLSETPFETARREAYEEIGLPLNDTKLPPPYRVEHLTELPSSLAKTELGVRPCIAFLSPTRHASTTTTSTATTVPDVETSLIPRLDAKEVSAVFSAPFHHFLLSSLAHTSTSASSNAATSDTTGPGVEAAGFPAEWYRGSWTDWHESRWRMHNFYVACDPQTVVMPKGKGEVEEEEERTVPETFRVFGMTARILVDAARVAYGEEPQFEHNSHFGDEDMIGRLIKVGRLGEERKPGDELTKEDMKRAANAKM